MICVKTGGMKTFATLGCAFLAVLLHCPFTLAWSGAGHQVIAAEAYRELSPDLKKRVTELLKSHPDYDKWEKSFTGDSANLDLPTFIFMRARHMAGRNSLARKSIRPSPLALRRLSIKTPILPDGAGARIASREL